MKLYTIYDGSGKILRSGVCCTKSFPNKAGSGEYIFEGMANDVTQKIEFDGLDDEGQPINPRVVNKTPEEIEADNPAPPEIPEEKRVTRITNEQWHNVLKRLENLENKA